MATTTAQAISILPNFTQVEEDALAATLIGTTAGSSVIYNTDLNLARIWDGSGFTNSPSPVKNPSLVLVRQLSDFPTPVSGVITLADEVAYIINGTIDIGTNRIVCGIKNTFRGNDRLNDKLISTTTDAMFTVDSSVTPRLSLIFDTITLQCPNGALFSVLGGTSTQLTLITTTISNTKSGGTITGGAVSIRTSSISSAFTLNGFVFSGANTSLVLRDSTVSNNAGTCFDMSTCTAISVVSISRSFLTTNASQTFMNATGIVVSFVGQIALCAFSGAGAYIVGITESDWPFNNNTGIANSPGASIPILTTDPISPANGMAWVLHQTGAAGGRYSGMLGITYPATDPLYNLSIKTTDGVKRVQLQ